MPESKKVPPSKNNDTYWIQSQNRTDENNNQPVKRHTGKWLLFHKLDEIDEKWDQINAATEAGKLGHYSCVSTVKHDSAPKGGMIHTHKVICVMTYSEKDYDDIVRVREVLRSMGYVDPIGYKTWRATRAKLYRHLGHRKICKYRM